MNKRYVTTTYIGLLIVLVLTTIFWFPSVYKSILSDDFKIRNFQMQAFDWLIVLIIIGLILFGERNKLSSLNIKWPNGEMLGIGLGLGGFSMIYTLLHQTAANWLLGGNDFENQLNNPALAEISLGFIVVYGVFSVLTAGIAEEIIYRGYATERLMKIQDSYWVAFFVPLLAFTLMHYRKGMEHMLLAFVVGALMQYYYLKFRNLTITIIGHLMIDSLALAGILFKSM
ncbi:MAG: CPBP family intramembrane glutamic endopeptidase [Bacteroidota bacterium]